MADAYDNISIDIETLGREPGCVILSIGVTPFNTNRIEGFGALMKRTKHWSIDRATSLEYFTDPQTLQWHMDHPDRAAALIELEATAQPLKQVLKEVSAYILGYKCCVWANSPQFDCEILGYAFKKEHVSCPWEFYEERDLRTALHIKGINKRDIRPIGFTPHRADHDAAYQALLIQTAFRR